MAHRIAGLGHADAVEKALSELGKPKEVSLGMARLYTLPKVAGSGIICAAICVFTLAAWPHTIAQGVKSIFYLPTKECVSALEPGSKVPVSQACRLNVGGDDVWLERQELIQTLRKQGVDVTGAETLTLAFPGTQPVSIRAGSPGNPKYDIKPADPSYISLSSMMHIIAKQNQIGFSVEGWNNPQIHFGDAVIQIGNETRLVPGDAFYESYLNTYVIFKVAEAASRNAQTQVFSVRPGMDTSSAEDYNLKEQTLEVSAEPGAVYGVFAVLDPNKPAELFAKYGGDDEVKAFYSAKPTLTVLSRDMARVEQDGTLTLYLPEQPLQFVKSLGARPKQGTAVLVKLSGSKNPQGYEVVPPEQVRYQALKYEAQNP